MNALDALNRARAAWERTQPQLTIYGLDQVDAGTGGPAGVGLIEPVRFSVPPPGQENRAGSTTPTPKEN